MKQNAKKPTPTEIRYWQKNLKFCNLQIQKIQAENAIGKIRLKNELNAHRQLVKLLGQKG